MDRPLISRTIITAPRGRRRGAIPGIAAILNIPIHDARLAGPFRLESQWIKQSFERIACLRREGFGHIYAACDLLTGGYERQIDV
jgi:hypothetical protein